MGQLIEANEGDLRTLVVVLVRLVLKMAELNLAAPGKLPLERRTLDGACAEGGVDFVRLLPQAALLGDLRVGAPKHDAAEAGDVLVLGGLGQDGPALTAAGRPAVDGDIGLGVPECGLRAFLGNDASLTSLCHERGDTLLIGLLLLELKPSST
ncbi:hypothetical protein D3C87_1461230 [compost metagenome]